MKTLEEIIAMVPEGYQWLIRSDETRGFMANITTPQFENDPDVAVEGKNCFHNYASTPQEALIKSVLRSRNTMA